MNSSKDQTAIISLSLNPAIDLTYEIPDLTHDQKTRAISTCYDPGGTGVNVGRALDKLNANSTTCCITAGKMGEFLRSMMEQELKQSHCLQIEGETRINTTLLQKSPQYQYEINALGPTVNSLQLTDIINEFLSLCGQGIGILTGSLPPGVSDNTYHDISTALQQQGGCVIIDAPIPILKKSLSSRPFLIKPNLHELQTLQGKPLNTINQIASEARQLVDQGIRYVCVSLGEKGAVLVDSDNSYFCQSPDITTHSTVGAGDSMVAGLAYAFGQQQSPKYALKLAVACGAGTAQKPGTQLFNLAELEQLLSQTRIETLSI